MMSLDGFFAAPGGNLDWFVFEHELERYIEENQLASDTLLFGRVTYQMMSAYWPTAEGKIATFMNGVSKYVFSKTIDRADWNRTTVVNGNAAANVMKLKHDDGKDIFVFGSADFTATLMRHGLVDEYRIGLNPIILGSGIPLFRDRIERVKLTLTMARPLKSGVVILHYKPIVSRASSAGVS
jgi:dihydrofolate reductase